MLQRGDAVENAAIDAGAGAELIQVTRQTLRTQQLAVAADDHVAIADLGRVNFVAIEEAVVLVAEIAWLVADGDLLREACAERVGAGHDDAVVDAKLEERVAAGADLRDEHFMRHGDLAVLVAALLLVRHLIFDLQGAGACFDHLLGEQIGRFSVAEARVDVGDHRHDVGLEVVDLVDQRSFLGLVASLTGSVELTEDVVEFARVGLTQEGVEFFDQCRHRGLLVHGLIRQRSEFGAQRCDHPARQVEITAIGFAAEVLLDRDQLLLGDEAVPAAQRLGVLGRIGVIRSHVRAHHVRGVTGDIEASLETVLQAHARHGLGGYAVPCRMVLEQSFSGSDLRLVGRRALNCLVGDSARLVIHGYVSL